MKSILKEKEKIINKFALEGIDIKSIIAKGELYIYILNNLIDNDKIHHVDYRKFDFSEEQLKELLYGIKKKIDISYCVNSEFSVKQIKILIDLIVQGKDVSFFVKSPYNQEKMDIILDEVRKGIHISDISELKKYDSKQLSIVLEGLEQKIDVSLYNNPDKYTAGQMKWIYWGLRNNIDVSIYNDPEKYTEEQMQILYCAMSIVKEKKLTIQQVQEFNNPIKFSAIKMNVLYRALIDKEEISPDVVSKLDDEVLEKLLTYRYKFIRTETGMRKINIYSILKEISYKCQNITIDDLLSIEAAKFNKEHLKTMRLKYKKV